MKRSISFITTIFILLFTLSLNAQVKNVQKETERQGTHRVNHKIDQGIDSGLNKLEEGIGSLFGKKKKKKKKGNTEQVNTSVESDSQESNEDFGAFTSMWPANGGTIAYPPFLDWEIPNDSEYKFTVHLEGDDWSDWLTKTTTKITNVGFSNLPTNTKNFKWQVIAEGNGQRLESPWKSFTTYDGTEGNTEASNKPVAPQMKVEWAKFDFVPGDEVIFEDAPSVDEENGEFPSRWDLYDGSAEIGAMNGKPIIMFLNGGGAIVPYLKNSKEAYLPEIFTIEFDVWFSKGRTTANRYFIGFRDLKNQWGKGLGERLVVTPTGMEFGKTDKRYPGTEGLGWSEEPTGKWRHISIAYTKGKFKAYMDDTRLINVPHLDGKPWGLTINAMAENMYLKNIRIAKGGVKYYDRVLSDGKIIVNGIRFDVNKATIKPESNGAINKIFQLMQKQTDLNFSVEGHTDSDGDETRNQTLSEQRAKAVKDRLISMGISSRRLKSTGWGESKPIGENGTSEGKANNRRVEFVKFEGGASSTSAKPASSAGNPAYNKINASNIDNEFDKFPDESYTPISGPDGIVNGAGTIFIFFTSERNLGKMEILDVDKNDNYKTTIKYATYNRSGETVSESNHFEIEGTFAFDLDKGNATGVARADQDFVLSRSDAKNTSFALGGENIVIRKYQ